MLLQSRLARKFRDEEERETGRKDDGDKKPDSDVFQSRNFREANYRALQVRDKSNTVLIAAEWEISEKYV